MYKIAVYCDECGRLITDEFCDKNKANDYIRKTFGYAYVGIHLCPDCNVESIRRCHLHKKKNLWN